jgi:elongation factor G
VKPVPAEYAEACAHHREKLVEKLAEVDDQLMISYVEGRAVGARELKKALRRATLANRAAPVLCGSALRNKGIQPMLEAVVDYLPAPDDVPPVVGTNPKTGEAVERSADEGSPFASLAFKIVADPYVGRLAYFRVYLERRHRVHCLQQHPKSTERFGRLLRIMPTTERRSRKSTPAISPR